MRVEFNLVLSPLIMANNNYFFLLTIIFICGTLRYNKKMEAQ